LVENKMRVSPNVIHPRSSGGNADKEWASVASVVPSSLTLSSTQRELDHFVMAITSAAAVIRHTARARRVHDRFFQSV
jgi:hypothetical protein